MEIHEDGCNIHIHCGGHGHHPKPCCDHEYAAVYSTTGQILGASPAPNAPGQAVALEATIVSTANIDVSQAPISGKVIVNKAGWYDVAIGVCAALNPLSSPLPVWSVTLFKNGVFVPGSTFAQMTLSPEQRANNLFADVFVHCDVGDELMIANTSINPLTLASPALGTNVSTNSALMKITLLKAD